MVDVGIDLTEYYPSVEWDILKVPAERHEKYYPCCAEPYPGNDKNKAVFSCLFKICYCRYIFQYNTTS